jgi:23S rRNA (guanosine2251-2'-O)-methyltransferase
MNKTMLGGFVSIKSVIESKSREIFKIYIERSRYDKVMRSDLRVSEQRQYASLLNCGAKWELIGEEEFEALMPNANAGGVAAEVGERIFTPSEGVFSIRNGYIAMLDGIEDPFNFAYAIRSLYAAGVDAVILPERNFFTASDTVIRSSAGASELIKACCVENLADACKELQKRGYHIASTAKTPKAKDLYRAKCSRPICVVFGGEKRGINKEILELSDSCIKIKYPRDCHYSLPACSAISVIAFEVARKFDLPRR